jgi:acyl-CoA dehydrogenase
VDAEDSRRVGAAVCQFVRNSVVPREEQIEDEDGIPDDLRAGADREGLVGYALPEGYGGLVVTMSEDVRLAMECGSTTPAFRSLFRHEQRHRRQVVATFGSGPKPAPTPGCSGATKAPARCSG